MMITSTNNNQQAYIYYITLYISILSNISIEKYSRLLVCWSVGRCFGSLFSKLSSILGFFMQGVFGGLIYKTKKHHRTTSGVSERMTCLSFRDRCRFFKAEQLNLPDSLFCCRSIRKVIPGIKVAVVEECPVIRILPGAHGDQWPDDRIIILSIRLSLYRTFVCTHPVPGTLPCTETVTEQEPTDHHNQEYF